MTHRDFDRYIDEIQAHSLTVLKEKNAKYSTGDAIHNFTAGADMIDTTPAMCAFAYMAKHLVALRDMATSSKCDPEDLMEKCGDIINYIAIIYAIKMDEENSKRLPEMV